MAKKIEIKGNFFIATDTVSGKVISRLPTKNITWDIYNGLLHIVYINRYDQNYNLGVADLVDFNGDAFASQEKLEDFLNIKLGGQVVIDAVLQDSTSPLLIVKASQLVTETTLTAQTAKDDYIVNVADATSFAAGQYLTIYNIDANRVFFSNILAINTLAITLDMPLDFEFVIGSIVSVGINDMSVDGSVTPQVFGIRNPTNVDIPLTVDITRLMFACLCETTVDLSKFGDIVGGLTKGIAVRRVDGTYKNVFNAKTNAGLKGLMYDFEIQAAQGAQQDGFTGRLTFAGQNKMGAVIRLAAQEDLQILIQDDLTDLQSFTMVAEGSHVVD
jgi:hypothetical protein